MAINIWTGETSSEIKIAPKEKVELTKIVPEEREKIEFKPEDIKELFAKAKEVISKISMATKFAPRKKEIAELKRKLSELTVEKGYEEQKSALLKQIEEMERGMAEIKAEEVSEVKS